ncbi:hypothetical protein [Tellurirhabdus rosea]|uniref:hypothetical protein n=1 Tax=Tellurirhabdus rosea TaxID=2674997 RepID=UPI002255005E|nr:hypothetical protein [Tellurirhabdus rosea]
MYLFYPFYPDHDRLKSLITEHREVKRRIKQLKNIGLQYLHKEIELSVLEDRLRSQRVYVNSGADPEEKQSRLDALEEQIQALRYHELPILDFYRHEYRQKQTRLAELEKDIRQLMGNYSRWHLN